MNDDDLVTLDPAQSSEGASENPAEGASDQPAEGGAAQPVEGSSGQSSPPSGSNGGDSGQPSPPPGSNGGDSGQPSPPPGPNGGYSEQPSPPPGPNGGYSWQPSSPPPGPNGGQAGPPPGGEPAWEEPAWEEPAWEEPAWEDPDFDDVSIASVAWAGSENWDRALYTLTNGNTAFASKGLDVGDTPFDYEEIRTSGGGYFSAPEGVVGHTHSRKGGALIIKQGETFLQQQYVWGNQGPVMSPKTSNITKQIGAIEEREDSDINGDGFIGAPEEDEIEVEVSSVVYDNPDAGFDRSIYKMTDGTVLFAEQGLSAGDLPYEGEELKDKNGSPIETKGVVGVLGLRNGFGIIYNEGGTVLQQLFKWGNRGPRISGKLRDVTKQVDKIEEREDIDVNGDGLIGGQSDEEAEVQSVIFQASRNEGFDRSLYKLTNGSFILGERGLEPGDLPFDNDPLLNADGSSYSADNAIGLIGLRSGLAVLLRKGEEYVMQQFSWKGRSPKAKGKERNITKRIHDFEDNEGRDFTGDGIVGEPDSGQDPEVSRVIFQGNDEFDVGLYQLNNGDLVFAETDLEPGDTPFEDDIINGKDGQPYSAQDVVGIYPIKRGFALVESVEGTYFQQGFRESKGRTTPYGKKRKVKNIDKIEQKTGFDINSDGLIDGDDAEEYYSNQFDDGYDYDKDDRDPRYDDYDKDDRGPQYGYDHLDDDRDPRFRLVPPFDDNIFSDPLA